MSKLFANALRLIKTTFGRFLSLTAIVLIGTAFYVGVSAISTVMSASVNAYDDEHNLKDITIYSNYGFDDDDVTAVGQLESVELAEGTMFTDVYVDTDAEPEVTRIHAYRSDASINQFVLRSGRLPEAPDEVLADHGSELHPGFPLGSQLTLRRPQDDLEDILSVSRVTVVGTIDTPLYLNETREVSTLSNQYIVTFLYIPQDAFVESYYTELNVLIKDGKSYDEFSDAYLDYAGSIKKEIETLALTQKDARRFHIRSDALHAYNKGLREYLEAEETYEQAISDAERELNKAEAEITSGWNQVYEGRQELADGEAELERGKAEGYAQLEDGRAKLAEGYAQLKEGKEEFCRQKAEYTALKDQLCDAQAQLNAPVVKRSMTWKDVKELLPEGYQKELQSFLEETELEIPEVSEGEVSDYLNTTYTDEAIQLMNNRIEAVRHPAELQEEPSESPAEDGSDDGEEPLVEGIETFKDLVENMGDSDPLFSRLAPLQINQEKSAEEGIAIVNLMAETLNEAGNVLHALETEALPDEFPIALLAEIDPSVKTLQEQLRLSENATLGDVRAAIKNSITQIDEGLAEGRARIEEAEAQLKDAERQLIEGEAELNRQIAEAQQKLDEGYASIQDAIRELLDARRELDQGWEEFEQEKTDGRKKLDEAYEELKDARQQIEDMEEAEWTVLDRSEHYASETFRGTIHQMAAIARIFPLFFIAVATLVCLTTMTRMVNEERGTIGIMRALGYSPIKCSFAYLLYAGAASVIGTVIGTAAGLASFPAIIYNTWRMQYVLPVMTLETPWRVIGISAVCFLVMMEAVTGFVLYEDMKSVPAVLMRPRPPKVGKDILLEKIGLLWNRLSFSWKITIRNLVRYRQRVIMTLLGVAGCTALLVTGFGISDAINDIIDIEYGEIMNYLARIQFSEDASKETQKEIAGTLEEESIVSFVHSLVYYSGTVTHEGSEEVAFVEVFNDETDMGEAYTVRDRETHEPLECRDGEVIISEKMSENLHLSVGDTILLEGINGETAEVRVSGIMELYIRHHVLLTKDTYRQLFFDAPEDNTLYVSFIDGSDISEEFKTYSASMNGVETVEYFDTAADYFSNMIKGINGVVIVLSIASMALAFVVLGNLTNVNIEERMREIATMKVLGFRPKEVENYIYKENNILVAAGALIGLPIGSLLSGYIMGEVEFSYVMFGRHVKPLSFLYSFGLTLVFGILVNLAMKRKLDRVRMVESLKSVE